MLLEIEERRLDLAERNIYEALKSDDPRRRDAASMFTIRNSHRARRRGWITTSTTVAELSVTANAPARTALRFVGEQTTTASATPTRSRLSSCSMRGSRWSALDGATAAATRLSNMNLIPGLRARIEILKKGGRGSSDCYSSMTGWRAQQSGVDALRFEAIDSSNPRGRIAGAGNVTRPRAVHDESATRGGADARG